MSDETKKLINLFEQEIWLYLDGSLNKDRMKYWDLQLQSNSDLKEHFNQLKSVLELYDRDETNIIESNEFEKLISKSIKTNRLFSLKESFSEFLFGNGESNSFKIAFGSILTVASILLLMLSNKPNNIKEISSELLKWNDAEIDNQIEIVDNRIEMIKNDELQKYLILQLMRSDFDRRSISIDNQIELINKQIENNNF
ncbi:MAG: hypothetical protein K9J12_17345 [Melioribacteraceae bacterium]|nr:hypothetical protein [Melioribacteraceae bacterium]MCF8263457.1 hypothetical protein [Melioribacteraceae bacterium]MCF8414071.1 hypothetical protein [Melioribacteraceae bacterium]MCF8430998.1 hypothetical protein [Melioribacteraceae bacterium]